MLALGLIVVVNLIWIPILSGIVGPRGMAILLISVVGIAIACVVATYVSARFSQFPYMIIDHNAGAMDSLRWSWEVTRGRVSTLFGVYTMVFLINLGGLLACFVGLLFTCAVHRPDGRRNLSVHDEPAAGRREAGTAILGRGILRSGLRTTGSLTEPTELSRLGRPGSLGTGSAGSDSWRRSFRETRRHPPCPSRSHRPRPPRCDRRE